MALKWEQVIQKPEYQKLSDKDKLDARKEYFEDVIVPQIGRHEIEDTWKEFNLDASNMEIDREIGELEKRVTPEPSFIDRAKMFFETDTEKMFQNYQEHSDRERLEGLRQRRKDNNPETTLDKYISSAKRGIQDSITGKLIDTYLPGENGHRIIYEPESTGQSIASGLSAIGTDLPLYMTGGRIIAAGGGGPILQSAGSFALPKGIDTMLDIKREKGDIELSDIPDIALSTGGGALEGLAFGAAGIPGQILKNKISSPILGSAVKGASDVALEGGVMLGAETARGHEITGRTMGEVFGTIVAMKMIHANPYAIRALRNKSKETGVPVEKLAENLSADQLKIIKDAETANAAAQQSFLKTEAQIKQEFTDKVQSRVIDTAIRSNYKDGKPVQEIVKLEQVPKEYLPHVADVIEGKAVIKPEILQKLDDILNRKDPVISQKYEDILPGPMRDMALKERNRVVEQVELEKGKLELGRENYEHWQQERPIRHEEYVREEMAKLTGDYRRYENQRKVRDKMDEAIEHTLSIMTPDEKFQVANDPTALRQFIDRVESGYKDLKKPYQKAVEEETIGRIIKETGYYPQHVIDTAYRRADAKIKAQDKYYSEPLKQVENKVKSLETNPEYQAHLKDMQGKPDSQVRLELESKLIDAEAAYKKQLDDNLINFQRVMGISPEYKSVDPKEYGSHYNNLVEFQKKSIEDLQKTFESANYLDMHVNSKAGLANKSRVIQQKLGEKVYREFADPIREATWTFTKELEKVKQNKKELMKTLSDEIEKLNLKTSAKEMKTEIIDFMYSRQADALPAMAQMGIKPKKWEDLSAAQQSIVINLDAKFKEMFDRINTARAMVGIDPLNQVTDYFTLIRKISFLERLGYNPHNISRDVFENIHIEDVKTKMLSFQFGKSRIKNERELERDLDSALDKYYYSALRTIHMTPVLGKLREAVNSEKLMIANPNAHQYLNMTLDFVSGKRLSEAKEITNYWANILHRNLTGAVLAGNLHTIVVQPSSAFIAAQEIGPRYLAQGLKDFGSKPMQDFAMRESKVLLTRVFDASIEEAKKGVTGFISKAQAKGIEYGMLPTKYTDKWAAQITWLGSYRYAKEALNLNHKGSVAYADDVVVKTQGSAERIDLAPIQHTPLGKLFTTFQTFGINQFNYLKDEVIGRGKINRLVAENVSGRQAEAQFGSDKYIKKPLGKDKDGNQSYNIYEQRRMKDPITAAKDIAKYAAILGAVSTVYELMDGATPDMINMGSPNPSPVSAFIEGATGQTWVDAVFGDNPTKQEVNLIDGLVSAIQEAGTLIPIVGGSAKYGGSNAFGAFGALVTEIGDCISGKPGAKPIGFLVAKTAGVPGATQIHRILRQMQKDRILEKREERRKKNPLHDAKTQMQQNNPFRKQTERYKDPGLIQGLF